MIEFLIKYGLENPRIVPYKTERMEVPNFRLLADNMELPKYYVVSYFFKKMLEEYMIKDIHDLYAGIKKDVEYHEGQEDWGDQVTSYIEKSFEHFLVTTETKWKNDLEALLKKSLDFTWIKNNHPKNVSLTAADKENECVVFCLSKHDLSNDQIRKIVASRIVIGLFKLGIKSKPNVYFYVVDVEQIDLAVLSSKEKELLMQGETIIHIVNPNTKQTIESLIVS